MIPFIYQIKKDIKRAHEDEANTHAMHSLLEERLGELHSTLAISASDPKAALANFCRDYIGCVPDYLEALYTLSGETGTSPFCLPFLNLACTYTLKPPEILSSKGGLYAFLPKAYLCHRMLEEVNDQVLNIGGAPLAPIDMSIANLVAYSLLGQTLADPLDHLVLMAMETTEAERLVFDKPDVIKALKQNQLDNWSQATKTWPSLTQDFTVSLQECKGEIS